MKFSIYMVLLVLGVSSHKCADSECDATSHLATRTKVSKVSTVTPEILISEFSPTASRNWEISGPPGDFFDGCAWAMNANTGSVPAQVVDAGTFDTDGLDVPLAFPAGPFVFPATYFLSEYCPNRGDKDPANIVRQAGDIYDSIGVPETEADVSILKALRSTLAAHGTIPGTDFEYIGGRPELIFRDASTGDWYQVLVEDSGPIFDAKGIEVDAGDFEGSALTPTWNAINPSFTASETGDPHIHTLSGNRYTLLREGSFLLWQFALEKPKVQWQLYAHYAGRQSFTKGLLLVDTSGPKPSSIEMTSEECQWQTKAGSNEWSPVTSKDVVLSGPSSRMNVVGQKDMKKKIKLFLEGEQAPVAGLKVLCRPGRHINLKIAMSKKKWGQFVSGELKGDKNATSSKISTLQLEAKDDQEFQVAKTWKELGGSSRAQQYLGNLDENPSQASGFIQTCDSQAEADAGALCRKHLGEKPNSAYFKECVFDVCSGAGEVAAEMAAEMLKF